MDVALREVGEGRIEVREGRDRGSKAVSRCEFEASQSTKKIEARSKG
jgi:hypothetical protein